VEPRCLDLVASSDGIALADDSFLEPEVFLNATSSRQASGGPVDLPWTNVECVQPPSIVVSNTTSTSASLQVPYSSYTKGPAIVDPINPQVTLENTGLPTPETIPQLGNEEGDIGPVTSMSLDSPRFVATPSRSKRRRLSPRSGHAEWLEPYIQNEQRRCAEHGTPTLYGSFLDQQWLNGVGQSAWKHPDILLRIWVGISSAYSVVALRETLATIRNEDGPQLQNSLHGFSRAERVQMIEKNDRQITAMRLLNRCHALKLWEDRNVGSDSERHWHVFDSQDVLEPKGPGNPHNISRCQATKALIKTLYPGMKDNTTEYNQKFNHVRRLEKLGQRLSLLTRQYGQGILGLLQGSGFQSATEEPIDISDQMFVLWLNRPSPMNAANSLSGFYCPRTLNLTNF
jgi:hypothetical protein